METRGKKLLKLALEENLVKNTEADNEDGSSFSPHPYSDVSDITDPTYKPEVNKKHKFRNLLQEEESVSKKLRNEATEDNVKLNIATKNERILNWMDNQSIIYENTQNKNKLHRVELIEDINAETSNSSVIPSTIYDESQESNEASSSGFYVTENWINNQKLRPVVLIKDITAKTSNSSILSPPIYDESQESNEPNSSGFLISDTSTLTSYKKPTTARLNRITNKEGLDKKKIETVQRPTTSTNHLINNLIASPKKKRTICKFCRISVTNFERHLTRHHLDEKEVKDYLKFSKDTKEGRQMRRNILALLRFEVDFENFVQTEDCQTEKLPCAHCKRIVAVKYLRRHYKRCIVKPINETGRHVQHRAASQTLVACASDHANINATLRVKKEVFSRMASDEIGFTARKDPLIRHFGEFYLKKHKRAQISLACSNKMRECARLLIELRRRLGKNNFSFLEALDPTLFDDVVLCAKAISGYDEQKKNFKAPNLALHMGTTLQQMCELTTHLLLKKSSEFKCSNYENKLKELKRFRFLVKTQWNNEVASLALKDLAEKKWNTPVMLPLTQDIIKFRNYILEVAEKNVALLRKDRTDINAFKKLVNAALAFTILFNRRRIGDVQYLEIDSYLKNTAANNQTEFMEHLTESERALTTKYKRVVAGGKGSRSIVILFPPNVQEYIDLLLEIRKESDIVPHQNQYVFAYPGVTDQWIRGDVVLKNFAKTSKIENPEAMTSNRLRKQIATLMQIINLDKSEYSQFAQFMGHTEKTHKQFYEITQDAYQTAKVAKLLTLFDKGKGTEYRNQPLKNIDLDPSKEKADSESENEDLPEPSTSTAKPKEKRSATKKTFGEQEDQSSHDEEDSEDEDFSKKKKKHNRVRWTAEQKNLVKSYFNTHIDNKIPPKKKECEKLLSQYRDVLKPFDWVKIKTFVYNTYTALNK